jgi:hypothetical protein
VTAKAPARLLLNFHREEDSFFEGGWSCGKEDARARATRQGAGKISEHPGRRIRSGGDRARARGEARRPVHQAGHCHRAVQSTTGRGQPQGSASGHDVGGHAASGRPRHPARPTRGAPALVHAIPGDASRAVEGRTERGLEGSAVTSGQTSGGKAPEGCALASCPPGCRHEGSSRHGRAASDGVRAGTLSLGVVRGRHEDIR